VVRTRGPQRIGVLNKTLNKVEQKFGKGKASAYSGKSGVKRNGRHLQTRRWLGAGDDFGSRCQKKGGGRREREFGDFGAHCGKPEDIMTSSWVFRKNATRFHNLRFSKKR